MRIPNPCTQQVADAGFSHSTRTEPADQILFGQQCAGMTVQNTPNPTSPKWILRRPEFSLRSPIQILQQLLDPHVVAKLAVAFCVMRVAGSKFHTLVFPFAFFSLCLVFMPCAFDRVRPRWRLGAVGWSVRAGALGAPFIVVLVGKPRLTCSLFCWYFGFPCWAMASGGLRDSIDKVVHDRFFCE